MGDHGRVRYGVFLTPDAKTSAAVTTITAMVRAQYGLVSAQRFPPHITLVGSLPLAVGEEDLVGVVESVVAAHAPLVVHNNGIRRLNTVVVFDVHDDDTGRPNAALVDLAADVAAAVKPLLGAAESLPADVRDRASWRGHLSLASHELLDRTDLRGEVESFIRALDIPYPQRFAATTVTVYRLSHPDWTGPWWNSFGWVHVRSVPLGGGQPTASSTSNSPSFRG